MADNPLVAEIKRLKELEAFGKTDTGQKEADGELQDLLPRLYQVAANSQETPDQPYMGPIETMLRNNDRGGLEARLGTLRANKLNALYGEAANRFGHAVNNEQSWGDIPQGVGATALETAGSLAMMASSVLPATEGDPGMTLPEKLKASHDLIAPLYPDSTNIHNELVAARTQEDVRQHQAEADAQQSIFGPDGKLQHPSDLGSDLTFGQVSSVGTRQFLKDAASSATNSANDPVVLSQGVGQAAVSMGEGALIQGVLKGAGKVVAGRALQGLKSSIIESEAAQLAALRPVMGITAQSLMIPGAMEEIGAIGPSAAQRFGLKAAEKFVEHLDEIAAGGSTGLTEARGAYDQTVQDITHRDPESLLKTSAVFRDLVEQVTQETEGNPDIGSEDIYNIAKARLAGMMAPGVALQTGLTSAVIGAALPEGQISALHVVSKGKTVLGRYLKDATKEGLEEFLQGTTGGIAQNLGEQQYVNPDQPLMAGVAEQAGQGALFGFASSAALKGHELAHGTGSLAGEASQYFADKKIAKVEAEGQRSAQKLIAEADALQSTDKIVNLFKQAQEHFQQTEDVAGHTAAAPVLDEMVRTPQVAEMPDSIDGLPQEMHDQFAKNMNRVTAITRAADLYNQATDPATKESLGHFLNDLLEPAKKFENIPKSVESLTSNPEIKSAIEQYQNLLRSTEALPQVQKAQSDFAAHLKTQTFSEINDTSARSLAALAASDLSLHGSNVKSETVAEVLAHASDGKVKLTETQRQALAGSLALIRAREEADKLRTEGNKKSVDKVIKDQVTVSRQVSHETDGDRMSAKQYLTEITKAVTSGDVELAKKTLARLGNFAQSHNNKIDSLNESYQQGGTDVPYQQYLYKQNKFEESSSNPKSKYPHAFLNPRSDASINHARIVDTEAKLLTTAHNEAAKAFPELGASPIEGSDLAPELRQGSVQEARKAALDRAVEVKQTKEAPKPESAPAAPEAAPAPTPAPVAVEKPAPVVPKEAPTPAPVAAQPVQNPVEKSAPSPAVTPVPEATAAGEQPVKEAATTTPAPAEKLAITNAQELAGPPPAVEKQQESGLTVPVEKTPAEKPVQAKTPTVAEQHPNLIQHDGENHLQTAFKVREGASRLTGKENITQVLFSALDSKEALSEFIGKETFWDRSIADAFKKIIYNTDDKKNVFGLAAMIYKNLRAANEYDEKKDKAAISLMTALKEGRTDLMVASRGKVLNLIEKNPQTGAIQFNTELLTLALLAGLHWHINASSREGLLKEDQIYKALGLDPSIGLPDDVMRDLSRGVPLADAKNSLATTITRFWGLKGDKDQPTGYTKAIPEAMADEVLRAMSDPTVGLVTVTRTELHKVLRERMGWTQEEVSKHFQTVDRYKAEDWSPTKENVSPLYASPDLLQKMVLVDPEPTTFFNDDKVPVPPGQLGNSHVPNSESSDTARKNMQDTQFRVHEPMSDLFTNLDNPADIVELAGGTDIADKSKYNKNDLAAREGKNDSLLGAISQFRKDLAQMKTLAGDKLSTLGKKYQYMIGANNRMMMQGAYNPQLSKVTREILMATWSKLDLSSRAGDHHKYMMLALSQALGQKVHKKTFEENVKWAEDALSRDFKPALDVISKYLDNKKTHPKFPVQEFKNALAPTKVPSSPLVVMALMEAARMQRATSKELKSFETPLYLEADGITNGPFNAMGLLTVNGFTEDWVTNVQRGGVGFTQTPTTFDQLMKKGDGADLYKASMNTAQKHLSAMFLEIRKLAGKKTGPQVVGVANNLFAALTKIFPDDIKWAGDDKTPELERGAGKGPVTQMVYGSGSPGVASGITSKLVKGFYEQLSAVLANPALADTPEHKALLRAMAEIASTEAYSFIPKGDEDNVRRYAISKDSVDPTDTFSKMQKDPQGFTFSPEEMARIKGNLTHLLVNPMRTGIEETLGTWVKRSADELVKVTGLMANVGRTLYTREIEKKVNEKIQALVKNGMDPHKAHNRLQSEFLTENELNEIWDRVAGAMPLVEVDRQNFLIAKNSLLQFWDTAKKEKKIKYEYSKALNGKMGTAPFVDAIDNPGVAAIPFFTIGMGDARMVREIFQTALENSFQVFDGINIPIDRIAEHGQRINEAARKAWQANVFLGVADRYQEFKNHPLLKELLQEMAKSPELAADVRAQMGLAENANVMVNLDTISTRLRAFAQSAQARMVALSKFAISFDQMSGTFQPHVSEGIDLTGKTNSEIAKIIDDEYQKAWTAIQQGEWLEPESLKTVKPAPVEAEAVPAPTAAPVAASLAPSSQPSAPSPTPKAVKPAASKTKKSPTPKSMQQPAAPAPKASQKVLPPEALKAVRRRHPSGVVIASKTSLRGLATALKNYLTKAERGVLTDILSGSILNGHEIISGTPEQVAEYQRQESLDSLQQATEQHPGQILHGFYAPGEKVPRIYLMSPKVETMLHELVHAATYAQALAYYQGKLVEGPAKESIMKLEGLMKTFLQTDHGLSPTSEAGRAMLDAKAEISGFRELHEQDDTPFQKAAALNEFMTWTLTNRSLAGDQKLSPSDEAKTEHLIQKFLGHQDLTEKFVHFAQDAWNSIKGLIAGKRDITKTEPGLASSLLEDIRFNTVTLTQNTFTPEEQITKIVQAHATLRDDGTEPGQLEKILTAFGTQVARHLSQHYSKAWLDELPRNGALIRPFTIATKMADAAKNVFPMNQPLERETFHMMVMALSTDTKFNPHALTEMSKIYDRFVESTDVNSFIDPKTAHLNPEQKAQDSLKKFLFLTGQVDAEQDQFERSTMLPVFIALATTNPEFRSYLSTLSMPKDVNQKVVGVNTAIEAVGTESLKRLENMLSGADRSDNMKIAIDQLTQHVMNQILNGASVMDNVLERVRSTSHGLNGKLKSLLQKVGEVAYNASENLAQSDSKLNKAASQFLKVVSFTSSDSNVDAIGEGWLAQMDRMRNTPSIIREFLGSDGLLGRTVSQSKIYDMYKKVRATVQQAREGYREKIPLVIDGQFSKLGRPTDSMYHTLYQLMGRSDLASLLDGRNLQDVLELAGNRDLRAQEIANLERDLEARQSPFWAGVINGKIDQLVKYMHGGPHGRNLLRNAYSISEMLGTDKDQGFIRPTEQLVHVIDQLITLRYLDKMAPESEQQFTQLVKDEPQGVEFILSYLKGQRLGENQKALEDMARFNHFKGALPYESTGHLIVAPDEDHTKLVLEGYERRGSYKGSSIENNLGSRSYYFNADGASRTQFNQGLIQNVQGTAYGVRTNTGLSGAPNAGYITNPDVVEKLAKQLHREVSGNENLLPVYDSSGSIVAFERTLSPEHLQHTQQDQHLGKMIGYWRGRQVEEIESQKINDEVIGHLYDMWQKDQGVPGEEERYENLFDSDKRVIQDAVRIMPRSVREALEAKFGEGNFPVRRNLVNQIAGYRSASIGDMWTGDTDVSPAVQEAVKKTLLTIFGANAYRKMVWAERNWQAVTATMRTNIVVRSMTVALANTVSGFYQLKARGVPIVAMVRGAPKKLAEIEYYSRANAKRIALEAQLHAETDTAEVGAVKARLRALDDSMRRLSIWPLIEAGEFTSIADVGQTAEEFGNEHGTIVEQLEHLADKLPPGLRDAARLGYIARDTALFQGLQKWVQYSDFVMKAIYYDHLLTHEHEFLQETSGYLQSLQEAQKSGLAGEDAERAARVATAKGRITEEFNNYDLPTGRGRQYLESMGLAWFLNYKIRAAKIGLSMIRNNPLDLLLFGLLPHPLAGGVPFTDNIFARVFQGKIGHAFGLGMVTEPIAYNSWYNLFGN